MHRQNVYSVCELGEAEGYSLTAEYTASYKKMFILSGVFKKRLDFKLLPWLSLVLKE